MSTPTDRRRTLADLYREDAERRASLAASFESILSAVWECERFERKHPFTVATVRSLARVRKP